MKPITLILLLAAAAFAQTSVTYTNGSGTCRYSSAQVNDCLYMTYTDQNGNPGTVWIAWSSGPTNWVQWGDPASPEPTCNNLTITTQPSFPTVNSANPGPVYGKFSGTCSGVDSDGQGYKLTFQETMEEYYTRGSGGKGGGGAGVKRVIVGGSITVAR